MPADRTTADGSAGRWVIQAEVVETSYTHLAVEARCIRRFELTHRPMLVAIFMLAASYASQAQTGQASAPSVSAELEQPPAGPTADPPSASQAAWKIGPLFVSGILDGYYSLGFNHAANHINGLRNFDDKAGQAELNMALMTVDFSPHPIGFHLDVGAGRAFDIMGATEKDATGMRFLQQAYIEVKPARWKGLELDFGKFSSPASAEVIATPGNWNYSRSLLFAWCTPSYNFGFRANAPIGHHFSTGLQLVSGWNNILTGATFRTVGWTGAWTPTSKISWTNTYYGGPDENKADRGMRQLFDTVLLLAPGPKVNLYANLDYLRDDPKLTPGYQVYGAALAARFALSRKFWLSPRVEWLNDSAGGATGVRQQVKEFTATGTYTLLDGLSAWVEFRSDRSNRPFFNRGSGTANCARQTTVLLGLVAVLGPKR